MYNCFCFYCCSCPIICVYPLSHYIHITDDYLSKSSSFKYFVKAPTGRQHRDLGHSSTKIYILFPPRRPAPPTHTFFIFLVFGGTGSGADITAHGQTPRHTTLFKMPPLWSILNTTHRVTQRSSSTISPRILQ